MSAVTHSAETAPAIREVALEQPWTWLAAGWRDIWRRPGLSLGYGLAVCVVSWLLTGCLFQFDGYWLVLPLAAGQWPGARTVGPDGTVSEAGSLGETSATCAAAAHCSGRWTSVRMRRPVACRTRSSAASPSSSPGPRCAPAFDRLALSNDVL